MQYQFIKGVEAGAQITLVEESYERQASVWSLIKESRGQFYLEWSSNKPDGGSICLSFGG